MAGLGGGMTFPTRLVSALPRDDLALSLEYDPELLENLDTISELPLLDGHRTVLFGGGSYSRSPPAYIGGGGPAFRDSVSSFFKACDTRYRTLPPSVQVEIDETVVSGNVIYPRIGGELHTLYETVREVDRPYVAYTTADDAIEPDLAFDEPGQTYFYLGSAGSFNYGHWLVDDLARVVWLAEHREGVAVLLPSHGGTMDAVRRDSLEVMLGGTAPPITFVQLAQRCVVRRLSFVSPVTLHPIVKLPEAMDYVRERIGRMVGADASPRRILVMRSPARGRVLTNAEAVISRFVEAGYQVVDPETLSFADQARLFGGAETVVGVMGAAMTNTIFCPAGCKVGYLAPEGWTEPFYWDLSNVMGHAYFTAFGAVEMSDNPAHLSDFTVDQADVFALLDAIEAA